MNRSEIRTLVESATGRTDKTTLINSAINIALRKVSSEALWNDLLTEAEATTTADTEYVALASTVRRLSEVRLIDGLSSYRIIVSPKTWVVSMFPDLTAYSSTKPHYGYLEGTTLYFVPPPDDAYTLRYTYYPLHTDLSDDTTETTIPQADEAVISYTVYWVFKSLEQHVNAREWHADYIVQLREAKRVDRNAAVEHFARPRYAGEILPADYWQQPFIRTVPPW